MKDKFISVAMGNATHVRMFGPDAQYEYQHIFQRTHQACRFQTPRGSVWLSYLECEALFGVCCWYRRVEEQEPAAITMVTTGNLDTSTLESHGSIVVLFGGKGQSLDATPELLTMNGRLYRATMEVFP